MPIQPDPSAARVGWEPPAVALRGWQPEQSPAPRLPAGPRASSASRSETTNFPGQNWIRLPAVFRPPVDGRMLMPLDRNEAPLLPAFLSRLKFPPNNRGNL